jgi:hypothetical protein
MKYGFCVLMTLPLLTFVTDDIGGQTSAFLNISKRLIGPKYDVEIA